jgi:hypothetical protein
MLNEKRAGMPIPKERPMPRIVAGTDLMAALRQSIEKAKNETPKVAAKQAALVARARSYPVPIVSRDVVIAEIAGTERRSGEKD